MTVLALATAVIARAGGAEIATDWRFYKPVALPAGLFGSELVELELDAAVFAHAAPGLEDLRLVEPPESREADSREVPYKLLVEVGEHRRAAVPVKMRDLGYVPNDHTTFVLDLQAEGDLHNEVEIQTSSANFQRRVTVEASDDGATWRVLQRDGKIFDFTIPERGFSTRDTRVRYPSTAARFLRVRVIDDELEPLTVRGAVVFFAQQLAPRHSSLPLAIVNRAENPEDKQTTLLLDAGSAGFPANAVRLEIPRRNFYRQATLEGSDDALTWAPAQTGETLYDFDTPKFVGSNRLIQFGESRYRYYRITIFNEDNPPLDVTGAQLRGFARKLIFSADAGAAYRLYYGNPAASAPSYELERIFPYLVTEDLPAARLGAHTPNRELVMPTPVPPPPARPEPFTERHPWLLPGVVGLAALLLGLFLARLARQVRSRLPPPE